ncbi:CHASE domain-containing protein, partial [Pseudomonas sp. EA_65y_Pfl1_P113]|uniref:CHASE domain-containing protein n=1 Tax=Pseudomonas sp. EA_65y_Pfl1_P113 TaxID=3088692 RepID=UPI0030DD939D
RVIVGQRQAVVSTNDVSGDAVTKLAERAVAMARVAPDDKYVGLADPSLLARDFPDLDLLDSDVPPTSELERRALAAEAAALADGVPGYRIKSLQGDGMVVAPQADEYFPVFYSIQPKTSAVYGMDYATIPDRRVVLERARDNDRIASTRTRLYQSND